MCYHAEFGRSLYVGYKRIQKNPHLNWEALELRSVGWKEWPTPRYTPLSDMCYHIKFGSSASKMEGNLKIGLSLVGVGQANLLEIRSSPTYVILPNLIVLGQTVRALLKRSAWKMWPSYFAFQGHSRSSERTCIDPPPMTSYLKFHSNHEPISYRFRDKRWFHTQIANFPTPRIFCAPDRGVPFEIGTSASNQKLRWWGYCVDKEAWRYLYITIWIQYRRTDRHRAIAKTAITHSVAR